MKGLILKDLMTLKKTFKSYLLLFLVYFVIDMMSDQSVLIMTISFIIATMIPIAAISYDERCKWDKLANTMPFSRREIVYAKYMLGFVLTLMGLGATFILSKMPFADRCAAAVTMGAMSLVYQAVLMPALYKFGSEKGRIIMMIFMLIPVVIFSFADKIIDFESMNMGPFIDRNITAMALAAAVITIAVYRISIFVSVKIYTGKEF